MAGMGAAESGNDPEDRARVRNTENEHHAHCFVQPVHGRLRAVHHVRGNEGLRVVG